MLPVVSQVCPYDTIVAFSPVIVTRTLLFFRTRTHFYLVTRTPFLITRTLPPQHRAAEANAAATATTAAATPPPPVPPVAAAANVCDDDLAAHLEAVRLSSEGKCESEAPFFFCRPRPLTRHFPWQKNACKKMHTLG